MADNGGEKRTTLETSEIRSSMIAIRVTPSEHELIRQQALGLGVSVTDLLVRAALGTDALAPTRAVVTNKALEERIERIERILIEAGALILP